ncbi:MAG: hypothetical protein HYT80_09075 [Euryarchaeota archaeon]|nr:hypothetical protein [Euryarchaeota archaeon]
MSPPEPPAQPSAAALEEGALQLGPHWRLRRFIITTAAYLGTWMLMIAFLTAGTEPAVYLVLLLPFYLLTLLFALRTPKRFRRAEKKKKPTLSFQNRLIGVLLLFVAIYLPFTFISDKIIPFAPLVEFFVFLGILLILYWLVGRSVGVAPSLEALPPAAHRRHKQVVLPIDDPHYQRTLFLNYEFVDKGRGAKTLARRIESALEAFGVDAARRASIVEDLSDFHEGWSMAFTRRSRERRRSGRDRRSQILRTGYTRFSQELEQTA